MSENIYSFECLNCGIKMQMDEQYAGMEVECPQCEKKFLSPEIFA